MPVMIGEPSFICNHVRAEGRRENAKLTVEVKAGQPITVDIKDVKAPGAKK